MRWFWAVPFENTVADPLVCDREDLLGVEDWELVLGKRVDWQPGTWVASSSRRNDGDPDDVLQTSLGVPVFSPRLQEARRPLIEGEVQFLPIDVFSSTRRRWEGFAIANILAPVSALDRERSTYSTYGADRPEDPDAIREVGRAVLRGDLLRGRQIVRLAEYEPSVYVSEAFVQAFASGRFTGSAFYEREVS